MVQKSRNTYISLFSINFFPPFLTYNYKRENEYIWLVPVIYLLVTNSATFFVWLDSRLKRRVTLKWYIWCLICLVEFFYTQIWHSPWILISLKLYWQKLVTNWTEMSYFSANTSTTRKTPTCQSKYRDACAWFSL